MIEQKIQKLIEEADFFLEEMRAIDRRKEALKMGIIPKAGTKWDMHRKQRKKTVAARELAVKAMAADNYMTNKKYPEKMRVDKEWGGIIDGNKNILVNAIGKTTSVKPNPRIKHGAVLPPTIHKHPPPH